MKKMLLFCGLLVVAMAGIRAQNYSVASVPDSLKKGARAVVREEEIVLEIKSASKTIEKRHTVFTIFSESGDDFSGYVSGYSKFASIESIGGTLYDAFGKEVKRVKKKDMEDHSYMADGALMDDIRYKAYDFYCRVYPYTVEFEDETENNGLLAFRRWQPLKGSGVPTQHSRYVIIAPANYEVRFKPVNCNFQPVMTSSGDKKVYTWEVSNLSARSREVGEPGWAEIEPHVLFAPSEFEVAGYKGDMSSWENYGKFINQLRAGRDALPDNVRQKVHELTDRLQEKRAKVYALYDYLQKNTRYINVSLGIGGWQPFPADYVATKRYGDCKALSNFMVALLKEAGIKANYVVIYGGEDEPELRDDFPSLQGNHIITCVPLGKDTLWLECTDQTVPAGYMGKFTGDRKAILIDDDGGHIVRTPAYSAADNVKCRVVQATISDDGTLDADVNTRYTGEEEEGPAGWIDNASADERQKYLNRLFNLPTYSVDKSHYELQKDLIPVVIEYLHLVSPNYASVSGRRLFVNPNLFDRSSYRLPADSVRHHDFVNKQALTDIDSVTLKIPAGYQPEAVPADVAIDSKFGKYAETVKVMPDKIVYYRRFEESVGRFPPGDYPELVKFYERLYKADHGRVVLVKKEN